MLNFIKKTQPVKFLLATVLVLVAPFTVSSVFAQSQQSLIVAVAANYYPDIQKIAQEYQEQTGVHITLVSGSTGKLYLQIINQAPYDLFFSADSKHPEKLIAQNKALKNSLVTYAKAKLVLITADKKINLAQLGENALLNLSNKNANVHWLSIANASLAPCGEAAEQVIHSLKLNQKLNAKIIRAENVSQVLGQVMSHAAQYGFVTYSQVLDKLDKTQIWLVPESYYQPIFEQAVVLQNSQHKIQARQFLDFVMRQQVGNDR